MSIPLLRRISRDSIGQRSRSAVDRRILPEVLAIVESVRDGDEALLRAYARRLDGLADDTPLLAGQADMKRAAGLVDDADLAVLERTTTRIESFARAQLSCIRPLDLAIEGGRAGHDLIPVDSAGCYAPGGRYPLPSSVLMTVITARVAGVSEVWLATPHPSPLMLAAAWMAGASGVLRAGGAHAIAALAYGNTVPACRVIAGPGNKWVTAAKYLVSQSVGIDMLAGPSELAILADDTADAGTIAADLLAQAEHDEDAAVYLVTPSPSLVDRVELELRQQLSSLPSRGVATASLRNGGAIMTPTLLDGLNVCDELAPEHLEIVAASADELAARSRNAGALFVGPRAGEVFGDYGAGPNHVLPTGGSAVSRAGLSILTFLRARTWLRGAEPCPALTDDVVRLARMEGLEGHARAAERRELINRSTLSSAQ